MGWAGILQLHLLCLGLKTVCWFVIVGSFVDIDKPHSHNPFKSKIN